jgi:hypothetical protein
VLRPKWKNGSGEIEKNFTPVRRSNSGMVSS